MTATDPGTAPPHDGHEAPATVPVRAAFPISSRPPLRDLWRHARGHRGRVVFSVVMSTLKQVFDVAPELLIGAAVDVVVNEEESFVGRILGTDDRFHQLYVLAAVTVAVWVAESVCQYIAQVSWRNLAQTLEHETRMEAYRHVQSLELAAFDDHSSGGLLTVLNDDVNQLERFLDVGADEIVRTTANVALIGVTFAIISPQLTVVAFLPIPLIVGGSLLFQRRLQPHYDAVRAAATRIADTLTNSLGGMATVKAFSGEPREVTRVEAESQHYREVNRRAIALSSAFVPLIRMAILAGFTVTLVVGGRSVLRGEMAVGSFSVLVFMTQRLLWPLTRLGEVLDLYQRAMASCRRIFGLLDLMPAIVEGTAALALPVRGDIAFEDVSFRYRDDPEAPAVLDGVSLTVPAGETHAIVGPTGAGKSTVVKLLLRLYEPQAGRILVDGTPVDELTFASLRGATGFVSQDVFLFHGTVRENLTYGTDDVDDERLWTATEAAEAAEFIRALPGGLDAVVGERGQKLSGGQRQRLTIARALVRDPAILLLDEATSAIDNETEAAIQRSLRTASEGRTSLVIAHRLSTIRHAHRIHVLDAGRFVEAGTHDELVAAGGLYAALWRVQTGEA